MIDTCSDEGRGWLIVRGRGEWEEREFFVQLISIIRFTSVVTNGRIVHLRKPWRPCITTNTYYLLFFQQFLIVIAKVSAVVTRSIILSISSKLIFSDSCLFT